MNNFHSGEASQIHEEHQHDAQARRAVIVPKNEQTLIDDQGNTLYLGVARQGVLESEAEWQIRKIETSAGITSIKFAGGSLQFNQVWDDRGSLSY